MPKTTPEENVAIVCDMLHRQYNLRDITAVDDAIHDDHVDRNPTPGQQTGKAGVRKLIEQMLAAGDFSVEIHDSIGSGDLVATRYTVTAKLHGDFLGFPAAGKTVSTHILEMDRLQDGKIIESWGESSQIDMLRQLDALPDSFFAH